MVTKLQANMIRKIAESEFNTKNGGIPNSLEQIGQIWADSIIEDAEDKGVFTSLLNAGLAYHYFSGSKNAAIELSETGFAAYKSL
jgi:hypothetical protein